MKKIIFHQFIFCFIKTYIVDHTGGNGGIIAFSNITTEDGNDVVEALRIGKEFDHKSPEPKLKASETKVDPDKPETETQKAHEEKQFESEFQEDHKTFAERLERH